MAHLPDRQAYVLVLTVKVQTSIYSKNCNKNVNSDADIFRMVRFVLPSMDGSPPKVVTFNEVADVVKNIQNMELAHEIALNPEFKLQPYEPPENR